MYQVKFDESFNIFFQIQIFEQEIKQYSHKDMIWSDLVLQVGFWPSVP